MHADSEPFVSNKDETDEIDLKKIIEARVNRENILKSESGSPAKETNQDSEGEIDSDELMLHIDEALKKITSALPSNKTKSALNK